MALRIRRNLNSHLQNTNNKINLFRFDRSVQLIKLREMNSMVLNIQNITES